MTSGNNMTDQNCSQTRTRISTLCRSSAPAALSSTIFCKLSMMLLPIAYCLLPSFLVCFSALQTFAQEFNIKRFEMAGDKLVVFYDLVDTVKNRHYTINVYSSKDNYLNPLQKISGDAGLEVKPGINKKITWNAKEELGSTYEGSVALEIRGRVYIPFVRFTGFEDYKVRKRGVPFAITWSGGTRQNILNFDLYKDDTKVWTQPNVANNGNFEITIPTDVKPGKDYRFKISDSKNKDDVVYTGTFAVKRKIPLALKALPTVAIAGAVYFLTQSSGGSPSGPKNIVSAPCPDGTNSCNE